MHPYEAALVGLLSTVTEDLQLGNWTWEGRASRLDEARQLFAALQRDYFPGDAPSHFDLDNWLDLLEEVRENGGGAVELPDPNFVTVE